MPPKKIVVEAVTTDEGTPGQEAREQLSLQSMGREGINLEDLNLPKSIVTRLAKGVLPPNTQIQSNAMLAMTKSATVFVNYLASAANENAQLHGKKTITPQDVFKALHDLEFGEFVPNLEVELKKFSDIQTDKRNTYRKKVAADKKGGSQEGDAQLGDEDVDDEEEATAADRDGRPAAKKARREAGEEGDSEMMMMDDTMGERDGEEDERQEDEEDEEQEDEEGNDDVEDEQLEPEEPEELVPEQSEDEALDNGEDSE